MVITIDLDIQFLATFLTLGSLTIAAWALVVYLWLTADWRAVRHTTAHGEHPASVCQRDARGRFVAHR